MIDLISFLTLGNNLSISSHPPHLTTAWGSAFVPFCAYKTNLNFSKNSQVLLGITFPLCSAFYPTILEGQLCYSITLNTTSGQGKRNELMFLLDYNEDRSLQTSLETDDGKVSSNEVMNFDNAVESIQSVSAKIHINTLSPYIGYGGGIYTMTGVKRMRAKEAFTKMSFKDRNCEVEHYESCRTRKLVEECNCIPGEVPSYQVQSPDLLNDISLFHKRMSDELLIDRKWRNVLHKAETASRVTQQALSTAALPVRGSLLTQFARPSTTKIVVR